MKILIIILLIFCFNFSKAQSNQDVVNDTLWTIEMNTFSGGLTVNKEHNPFYAFNLKKYKLTKLGEQILEEYIRQGKIN